MPVPYCLGIHHEDVAKASDPHDVAPLQRALRRLVPKLTFGELQRIPSFTWTDKPLSTHVLAQLRFAGHGEARDFRDTFAQHLHTMPAPPEYAFGNDPPIHALDTWSPIGSAGGIFGNRDTAERLTRTDALKDRQGKDVTGKGVNVVIVDRGLSRAVVQETAARMAARRGWPTAMPQQRVQGWTRIDRGGPKVQQLNPGEHGSEHGTMIARNVLAMAPEAVIWDAPLLPSEDEPDAPPGTSDACELFHWIRQLVRSRRKSGISERWVIVNAWGVMDPETAANYSDYADNPDNPLVNDMVLLDDEQIDVVFAAGNCGEPCPDRRCGQDDCGPGRSIFGMNAHPCVLSVGAVRADGIPIALSAQGPGRLARKGTGKTDYSCNEEAKHKPDLCAPSHFRESDDAAEVNTGTSAACGFAAGIVAALRSVPDSDKLTPAAMRDMLRKSANPMGIEVWDPRLGFGVIDGAKTLESILG